MSVTLTTAELGERWGMNPGTLANWRMFKRGPVYQKKGSRVTYTLEAVEAFEKASEIKPRVESKLRAKRKRKNGSA
jgi:hypothetical protein